MKFEEKNGKKRVMILEKNAIFYKTDGMIKHDKSLLTGKRKRPNVGKQL